jgi:anti-sigma factor RsiW
MRHLAQQSTGRARHTGGMDDAVQSDPEPVESSAVTEHEAATPETAPRPRRSRTRWLLLISAAWFLLACAAVIVGIVDGPHDAIRIAGWAFGVFIVDMLVRTVVVPNLRGWKFHLPGWRPSK